MQINILNWNVAGAKFLGETDQKKKTEFRENLNEKLRYLTKEHMPSIITLQEIIRYRKPHQRTMQDVIDPPSGYYYYPNILIDTERYPYVSKWRKIQKKGKWPPGTYFAQGNAILWRNDCAHFPIWSLPKIGVRNDHKPHVEEIPVMSGFYFGDRNTEPRAAMVAHFVITRSDSGKPLKKPLDVFVVNVHLTTLTGEREGIPEIDEKASKIRLRQLDIVLNGIVSRYNDWRRGKYQYRGERRKPDRNETFKRHSPIWILCGDFNFTPESAEHTHMSRANFVDLHPKKGHGTKGSGYGSDAKPTLTCDYIFAGPQYIALNPIFTKLVAQGNPPPFDHIKVSDHFPLFAEIPLSISLL